MSERAAEGTRRHNYELERRLAARLRAAPADERRALYTEVYDEYFSQAIDAPTRAPHPRAVAREVRLTTRFLPNNGAYAEIGAGRGEVAAQVAQVASRAYAIEVSNEVLAEGVRVEVVISDGVSVPLPEGTIDLVYSNQLMEHLHPDDAAEQVRNVRAVLKPGGVYLCITPNRLDGPHDVSRGFCVGISEGFHLREYTIGDLRDLFLESGFSRVKVGVFLGGEVLAVLPAGVFVRIERVLSHLPRSVRKLRVCRKLLNPGGVLAYA